MPSNSHNPLPVSDDARIRELEAEVERLREALETIAQRAGWFMDRGATDFSYEDISERLGLALQDLSVIRRKAREALEAGER